MTTPINSDLIGKVVSFETYAQYILGSNFERCKVQGILDIESARHYADVNALANAIYSSLPVGAPQDANTYSYLKILQPGKTTATCVAIPWIKPETLTVHTDVSATFTVSGINASDVSEIVSILARYNYKNVSTKII